MEKAIALSYADYLRLRDLLRLQRPLSEYPDEIQLIILHQAFELWFKLVIYEIQRTSNAMENDNIRLPIKLLIRMQTM